jgi:glycine cleavage system aminomethyltransferase T/glycine/D-amino acid oxidase-like deaminating enzyme
VTELPSRAQVVVIGGGVIGCSTTYHLAALGWTDVLLLEQGRLSGGTTWHAAGLVGPLRASESGTRLVQYSAELYDRLEAETGLATGYRNVGGVVVARTEERMVALRRTAANAVAYDLDCRMLTPDEAGELVPPMRTDDLLGAIHLPGDGKVNPTDLTQSLAKGARMRGATVREGVRVTGLLTETGPAGPRVTGVRTDAGDVEADVVVNCAGQWAKAVASLATGADLVVPLHSAEHFYVVTEEIEGVHPDLPVFRDPDGWTYFKEEVGGLVVGGFEPDAKPWVAPDRIPHPFEFQLLEEDWEHFSVLMEQALIRVPALETTGIRKFYNGPESFTPDNQFLMGEVPGLRGFFVGAGFNSVGIASAGGAGRALAEWIVAGEATSDLVGVDVRRFAAYANDNDWLRSRVAEVLGLHYEIPWPLREPVTARDVRTSPLHERLAEHGAQNGSRMGWERPLYFVPAGERDGFDAEAADRTWTKPAWLPWSAGEQRATRQAVAAFDQTSFSKYVVWGRGALDALQWICAADVDVPVDHCVYTPFLNARGTYEADLTVTRIADDEFWLVSSSATTVRDLDWLGRRAFERVGDAATVEDRTDGYSVIGVMGPRSRDLLTGLTDADLSEEGFAFATSHRVLLAGVMVRATRMTYVGELGWELTVPVGDARGVHDAIRRAGRDLGFADAGYHAIESLRLEKGFRAFGRELTPDYTPVEAGLLFATALKGDKDFLGRVALEAHRAALAEGGARRRLVSMVVDDPPEGQQSPMLWGGELLRRDGRPVGQVTSAAWGETVGSCVGLAYVRHDGPVTADWLAAGEHEVDVAGTAYSITLTLKAPL